MQVYIVLQRISSESLLLFVDPLDSNEGGTSISSWSSSWKHTVCDSNIVITASVIVYFNHQCALMWIWMDLYLLMPKVIFTQLLLSGNSSGLLDEPRKDREQVCLCLFWDWCSLYLWYFCPFLLWYSASSSVHTAPFSPSTRTKHLWRLRLCRTAFWWEQDEDKNILVRSYMQLFGYVNLSAA